MFIWMVLSILVNGKMIDRMEKEKKYGQMELVMKDNTKMVKKTEEVHSNGLMDLFMWETSFRTIFKDKESIVGRMVENMLENGRIIKWMAKEYIY
mgnify:CR=1 FL=1